MSLNILFLFVSLSTLGLVFYIFLKLRDQNIQSNNQSSFLDEKFKSFSEDINKIGQELTSVTTPINELNRFLGGNVTTGRLGEWSLESIVQDIMPDGSYKFQHMINPQTRDKVDCTVTTADGIYVPIDSKFYSGQFKNYQSANDDKKRKEVLRDLRTAILRDAKAISQQYILQNMTSNYAILYIASEKLIDLVDKIDALRQECLAEHKILIQGPNTLAAFLDTVRIGHNYLKLNETAQKVAKVVRQIQVQFSKFDESTEAVEKKLNLAIKDVQEMQTRINVLGSTLNNGADYLTEEVSEDKDG